MIAHSICRKDIAWSDRVVRWGMEETGANCNSFRFITVLKCKGTSLPAGRGSQKLIIRPTSLILDKFCAVSTLPLTLQLSSIKKIDVAPRAYAKEDVALSFTFSPTSLFPRFCISHSSTPSSSPPGRNKVQSRNLFTPLCFSAWSEGRIIEAAV